MQFNIPAEHKNASGVYIIRNSVNDKVYVGSAVNFWVRRSRHVWELTNNCHHNKKLSRAVAKYGIGAFIFNLLELCPSSELLLKEQYHIDAQDAAGGGYNIARLAIGGGFPCSEENKAKLSAARKGRQPSEQTLRGKLVAALERRSNAEARHCAYCGSPLIWREGEYWSGFSIRKFCNRTCLSRKGGRTIADAMRGKPKSKEAIEKRSASRAAKRAETHPVRECATCGRALPTRRNTQRYCDSICFNKRTISEETRKKLSQSSSQNGISPETRAKQVETRRRKKAERSAYD